MSTQTFTSCMLIRIHGQRFKNTGVGLPNVVTQTDLHSTAYVMSIINVTHTNVNYTPYFQSSMISHRIFGTVLHNTKCLSRDTGVCITWPRYYRSPLSPAHISRTVMSVRFAMLGYLFTSQPSVHWLHAVSKEMWQLRLVGTIQ
jgi:hypothetical protein